MIYRTAIRSAMVFAATMLLSATAQAQLFRAYLAPTGSDANPCSLQQPCRLLPAALTAVADGGEIWMLDSGNYNTGPVNITKSVTILAVPGALGSVVAAANHAINIATVGVEVALRNLVIVPLPGGGNGSGINMTAGATLTVENCLIANLSGNGIQVSTAAAVRVTDSTIRDNSQSGLALWGGARASVTRATISGNLGRGVSVEALGAHTTSADIANATIDGNGQVGVYASSSHASGVVKASVSESLIARNPGEGLHAAHFAGAVTLSARSNTISNNGDAVVCTNPGCKVWASGNAVSDNSGAGFKNTSTGAFESAGNNVVRNNVFNVFGTITVVAME